MTAPVPITRISLLDVYPLEALRRVHARQQTDFNDEQVFKETAQIVDWLALTFEDDTPSAVSMLGEFFDDVRLFDGLALEVSMSESNLAQVSEFFPNNATLAVSLIELAGRTTAPPSPELAKITANGVSRTVEKMQSVGDTTGMLRFIGERALVGDFRGAAQALSEY